MRVQSAVIRTVANLAFCACMAGVVTAPSAWCAEEMTVAGVVRDTRGTPLLGAMVELLGQHASVVARGFTDDHGRYLLHTGLPGEYQLRASGAFLQPATLGHLRLQSGMRAVADLTMLAMFQAGSLLPAEKRNVGEPTDDWRWTLRSISNRPLLRWTDQATEASVAGVPAETTAVARASLHGQLTLVTGDGRFGEGGANQEIAVRCPGAGDDVSMLRAAVQSAGSPAAAPTVRVAAGLRHEGLWGAGSNVLVSFASHPDLRSGVGTGLQVMHAAVTDRIVLGDELTVDAGTLLTVEQMGSTAMLSAPYLQVSLRPSPGVTIAYRVATDRGLQSSEDLERGAPGEQVLVDGGGRLLLKRSLHQELMVGESGTKREVSLAVYRDSLPVEGIEGEGSFTPQDAAGLPVIVDPDTEMLRIAVPGYRATGIAVAVTQVLAPFLMARFEGQYGTALSTDGAVVQLAGLVNHMRAQRKAALSGTLVVNAKASGTVLNLRYRWQPARTLTQVDEFDVTPNQAYVGFNLRQRLCRGRHLQEVDAVVDATNLLAQGYATVADVSGRLIGLAQAPRAVQGGLAFTF